MNIFIYDSSFEGLLTVVFDSYLLKQSPDKIVSGELFQASLFGNPHRVVTDIEKADQIWMEIKKRSSAQNCDLIYKIFLSEITGIEMKLFQYIKLILETPYNIEQNYREEHVLELKKTGRRVAQEATRMIQFVRFQRTADNVYFAALAPEFNVLPLIIKHFRERYADQKWILYDTERNFGFFYDLKNVTQIGLQEQNFNLQTGKLNIDACDEDEMIYQYLWKNYYKSINIKERRNLKQQLNFMPRRYWRYLPEKQI